MKMKILGIILGILLLGTAVATGIYFLFLYAPNNPPVVDDSGSTQDGTKGVVDANNQFAFDLYSKLSETEKGNIFYSPYSISAALAMTYEGARGETAKEISSVFHFPEPESLRSNFASIYNDINSENEFYELKTGNALWLQQDYKFLDDYINSIEKYYGGKAANLDFVRETEKSRQTINSFIEEQTNNKIKDLIPQGVLDPMTRMVLTNAIYFKGSWEAKFDKKNTEDREFRIFSEERIDVPMMYMSPGEEMFNYANLEKLQILELPYRGDKLSALILLPKQGMDHGPRDGKNGDYKYTLDDIELSAKKLNEYKSQMRKTSLDAIYLPRFEFETKSFMAKTLSDLGMSTAFSDEADFSGMDGTRNLTISEVIHQAFVKVDEEGTEAAAATAVVMKCTSAGPIEDSLLIFKADHPFIFIIQEKETGNILFIGRVVNPSK